MLGQIVCGPLWARGNRHEGINLVIENREAGDLLLESVTVLGVVHRPMIFRDVFGKAVKTRERYCGGSKSS